MSTTLLETRAFHFDKLQISDVKIIEDRPGPPRQLVLRLFGLHVMRVLFSGQVVHLAWMRSSLEHEPTSMGAIPVLRGAFLDCGSLSASSAPRSTTASTERLVKHLVALVERAIGSEAKRRKRNLSRAFALLAEARGWPDAEWIRGWSLRAVAVPPQEAIAEEVMCAAGLDPSRYMADVHVFNDGAFKPIRRLPVRQPAKSSAHERLAFVQDTIDAFAVDGIDVEAWLKALGALA